MQERHDFKYPWKVLSQVSLRLRDWSPRILKASYGIKLQNDKVISKDCAILDEEVSTLKTEHQPRMLKYFSINRTAATKNQRMDGKSTGQDAKSTLVGSLEENIIRNRSIQSHFKEKPKSRFVINSSTYSLLKHTNLSLSF